MPAIFLLSFIGHAMRFVVPFMPGIFANAGTAVQQSVINAAASRAQGLGVQMQVVPYP